MKISNSKKQLAKIIHENGGWREGADTCSCDNDGYVNFFVGKPTRDGVLWIDNGDCEYVGGTVTPKYEKIKNWHQTILSRDEYFRLYQEQGLEAALGEPFDSEESKPTIEQLAADYRNRKDYADRKQEEADRARDDADEALRKLELAGEGAGLIVKPIQAMSKHRLVIADYHKLHIGDILRCVSVPAGAQCRVGDEGAIKRKDNTRLKGGVYVEVCGVDWFGVFGEHWEFIRRP